MPALKELVEPKMFGMLATIAGGTIRTIVSRPVTTLEVDGADTLWFMVATDSSIAIEVKEEADVCLSYMSSDGSGYLSLRGHGAIVRDRARIESLWNAAYTVWFDGPADPNIALLCVTVREMEHWDAPSTTTGRLFAFAKALATLDPHALGSHSRGAPS